ncbi:MAG: hypothetical protein KDC44_02510, partial [Phaeodactylibacter sp.]|nr:hypothetical protein [Phaeodactylibacter sp.]
MKPKPNRSSTRYEYLAPTEFNAQQRALHERYFDNSDFKSFLNSKLYHEWPATLDYLLLVEREISAKKMPAFFIQLKNQQAQNNHEADAIRNCDKTENYWSAILCPEDGSGLTTPADLKVIDELCRQLAKNQQDANAILVAFFMRLLEARQALSAHQLKPNRSVEDALNALPANWYAEPWYYT